ncbi:extracellular calcium-sensing receptor-like [Bufo gargarizans]|uniref:extracellular calcium-sensing receptor-like n=1 Tax=Bufo gargarizans TaxID=30331 RepID=UPI001CF31CB2|nr:extracellular calcium-sensing receptor-like [Bufo gargarizans]
MDEVGRQAVGKLITKWRYYVRSHVASSFGQGLPTCFFSTKTTDDYLYNVNDVSNMMFHLETYQQIQVLIFAVQEINNNINILPNMTVGFQVYDSCNVLNFDLRGALQILTGSSTAIPNYRCVQDNLLSGFIGPAVSTHSILLAHILGLYKYPQISHFSTSRLLSDRTKFPSFFRTVPNDIFQSQGLAKLVFYFGWTWVGLVAVDNDYGQQGIQVVKHEITKAGACVAFTENILISQADRNAPHVVKTIKESTVKVVIIFSTELDLAPILEEMTKQNISGITFVASEGWSTSTLFSDNKFSQLLPGTIGLSFFSGMIPEFQEFIHEVHPLMSLGQTSANLFWKFTFGCTLIDNQTHITSLEGLQKQCSGTETLRSVQHSNIDVSNLRTTNKVYLAVHVFAKALEELRRCRDNTLLLQRGMCIDIRNFKPWQEHFNYDNYSHEMKEDSDIFHLFQLLRYLKRVRMTLNSGKQFYFDENGDPPAVYDIVNWQLSPEGTLLQVRVGSYDTTAPDGQVFTINSSALVWATRDHQVPPSVCSESCPPGFRKAPIKGQPVCCFECVGCSQGEISNYTDAVDCFKCPKDRWPNPQKSQCLQKPIDYLSFEEPLGTTLMISSTASSLIPSLILRLFIKHKNSPIVKANNLSLSCLLLTSLSLCFLCSLVFIGYPIPEKCLLRQVAFGLVFTLCISCILAKTILVVFVFMATRPGTSLKKWASPQVSYFIIAMCFSIQLIFCITWLSLTPPFPQYSFQVQSIIIVECNEGSPIAFWIMLGYLFLLATISFIVAFLARRLPDTFNEAQFITFSMMAFLSVWISYIPASLSAQGKYTIAMEIFGILASSWALVICMFLPKCFILLFRPQKNTREYLMKSKFALKAV